MPYQQQQKTQHALIDGVPVHITRRLFGRYAIESSLVGKVTVRAPSVDAVWEQAARLHRKAA